MRAPGAGPRRLDRGRPGGARGGAGARASSRARSRARSRRSADASRRSRRADRGGARQAALDRLGLEARAGHLILGSEKIEIAARRGEVALLLHAADAERGRAAQARSGLAGRLDEEGSGRQGLVLPADAGHIVVGAGPRECGTWRRDRSCRGGAGRIARLTGGALLSDSEDELSAAAAASCRALRLTDLN